MVTPKKYRWSFNFDLKEKLLREHYYPVHSRNPWSKMKEYMEKNGFPHRQYSGYLSEKLLSDDEIRDFNKWLHKKFDWFKKCAKVADFTVQRKFFSSLAPMKDNLKEKNFDENVTQQTHGKGFEKIQPTPDSIIDSLELQQPPDDLDSPDMSDEKEKGLGL